MWPQIAQLVLEAPSHTLDTFPPVAVRCLGIGGFLRRRSIGEKKWKDLWVIGVVSGLPRAPVDHRTVPDRHVFTKLEIGHRQPVCHRRTSYGDRSIVSR